ncbi:hypothetical protein TUZN_1819 [Thermoproteus uzoniensis 768-20]|uniref:Uncharacterized protein n=1 Tax=Thermoproteus uzoniensis (strain 768-20) TaxID=999630 RepID=F2L3W7_THEU7|nr:hypothetical protein [Thermoproteus uzoniensis]AEA13279.1 hypothetical protein TUZN_1819 [Thermoproteus uzoniensis 768-20]
MDLLCAEKLSCTPADHRAEAERAGELYPLEKILEKVVDVPGDALKALASLRSNNIKNRAFSFLSGSLLIDCSSRASPCPSLQAMARAGLAESLGDFYYVPYTALSERLLEYLPIEDEETQQIKRPYVVSLSGIGGGDVVEALSGYISSAGYFLWGKVEKILTKISFIPQLINKYNTQIDILIKLENKYIIGIKYLDITRTVHMGFSAINDYLRYGLDYAILLHPHVNPRVHRSVANRIGELEISPSGYMALDLLNETLYIYRFPKHNTYLSKYISSHSQSMALRSYIESL